MIITTKTNKIKANNSKIAMMMVMMITTLNMIIIIIVTTKLIKMITMIPCKMDFVVRTLGVRFDHEEREVRSNLGTTMYSSSKHQNMYFLILRKTKPSPSEAQTMCMRDLMMWK